MMTKLRERDSFLVNARAVASYPRKHMALEDPIQIIEERE